jgi:hypothetical protein
VKVEVPHTAKESKHPPPELLLTFVVSETRVVG